MLPTCWQHHGRSLQTTATPLRAHTHTPTQPTYRTTVTCDSFTIHPKYGHLPLLHQSFQRTSRREPLYHPKFLAQVQQARALVQELQTSGKAIDVQEPRLRSICNSIASLLDSVVPPLPPSSHQQQREGPGVLVNVNAPSNSQGDGAHFPAAAGAAAGGGDDSSARQEAAVLALGRGDSVMSAVDLELALWRRRGGRGAATVITSSHPGDVLGGPIPPVFQEDGTPLAGRGVQDGPLMQGYGAGSSIGDIGDSRWQSVDEAAAGAAAARRSYRSTRARGSGSGGGGWSGAGVCPSPGSSYLSRAVSEATAVLVNSVNTVNMFSRAAAAGAVLTQGLRRRISSTPGHGPATGEGVGAGVVVEVDGGHEVLAAADAGAMAGGPSPSAGVGAAGGPSQAGGRASPFLMYNLMALES